MAWVTKVTRNFTSNFEVAGRQFRFLVPDIDTKFTASFDAVFIADGIRINKSPVRAPRANAFCERVIGNTIWRGCLDWVLILGQRHLAAVLAEYVEHYNSNRPHRSLDQRARVVRMPSLPPLAKCAPHD